MQERKYNKIVVALATYNRPKMLYRLLQQIQKWKGSWEVKVKVYDDASTEDYSRCQKYLERRGWDYTRFEQNHGRERYWKLVDYIYQEMLQEDFHYFIHLGDDLQIEEDFFTRAVELFDKVQHPKRICMNLLVDVGRAGKNSWTNVTPTLEQYEGAEVWNSGWMDMCYIATPRYFRHLGNRVYPVDQYWIMDPKKSSGVGKQLSERLVMKGFPIHQVAQTLVHHGQHESRMHREVREKVPLVTRSEPVMASMATFPERLEAMQDVVKAILPQVDKLKVYLNGYEAVPEFLNHEKVEAILGEDLGDAGKFYRNEEWDGYVICIDDDLEYPPNFVDGLLHGIEKYKRQAVVSYHGRTLKATPIASYYRKSCEALYRCLSELKKDQVAHILGTGVMGYHSSTIRPAIEDFPKPNMADIWLGLKAQREGVPMVVLRHQEGYIRHSAKVNLERTIASWHKGADEVQTSVCNSITWKLNPLSHA